MAYGRRTAVWLGVLYFCYVSSAAVKNYLLMSEGLRQKGFSPPLYWTTDVQWHLFAVCLCMRWLNFPRPDLDLVAKKLSAVATVHEVIGLASHLKFITFLSMLFLALTLFFVFLHIPLWKTCSLALGAGTADFGSGWAVPCTKLCKAVYWSCDCRNERGACVLAGLVCGLWGCIDLHVHMCLIYLLFLYLNTAAELFSEH